MASLVIAKMKGTSYADSSVATWNTDPADHFDHAASALTDLVGSLSNISPANSNLTGGKQ